MSEDLVGSMDELERESKRARTIRSDYIRDSEALTDWLQTAELRVQDKTSDPHLIKESLQRIQSELPQMQDKLDRLTMNSSILTEKLNNDEEKNLIINNVHAITEQMNLIKSWIDEKKQQIGDCLDSWERFLTLYNTVMNWVREKREFIEKPLQLDSLTDAKQKLHDYAGAVKSDRNMSKVVSDMSKELDKISETGTIGELSSKMEEAETAKADVESSLLQRHALLSEVSEEWDQCEKKLREVRAWIDKSKGNLESGAGKKKPLRDQLASREKMMADINIQKTKIDVSLEKLRVHFKSVLKGADIIFDSGDKLKVELDSLLGVVRQQSQELEATLAQVESYQEDVLKLKQEVVSSEQKLRMVSNPAYMPNERETALQEQNDLKYRMEKCREELRLLAKKIQELDPRWQPSVDLRGILSAREVVSYAKVVGISCSVESKPISATNDNETGESWLTIAVQTRGRSRSRNRSNNTQEPSRLMINQQYRSRSKSPMIQSADSTKLNVSYSRSRSKSPMGSNQRKFERDPPLSTGLSVALTRARSKSPMFVPGTSASFSDVVRGCSRNNSRAPSVEDLSLETPVIKMGVKAVTSSPNMKNPSLIEPQPLCNIVISSAEELEQSIVESGNPQLQFPKVIESKVTLKKVIVEAEKINTSGLPIQQVRRSKSPIYEPGKSIPYSQMLQHNIPSNVTTANEGHQSTTSSVQKQVVTRGRSPSRRMSPPKIIDESSSKDNDQKTYFMKPKDSLDKSEKLMDTSKQPEHFIDEYNKKPKNFNSTSETKLINLCPPQKLRSRSKSPVYIPGESATYSDILKGASSRSNSPSTLAVSSSSLSSSMVQLLEQETINKTSMVSKTPTKGLNSKSSKKDENKPRLNQSNDNIQECTTIERPMIPNVPQRTKTKGKKKQERDDKRLEDKSSEAKTLTKDLKEEQKYSDTSVNQIVTQGLINESETLKKDTSNLSGELILQSECNENVNNASQITKPDPKMLESNVMNIIQGNVIPAVEYPVLESNICIPHRFSLSHVDIVPDSICRQFIEAPVTFIASGQQLMDSGLGTYHPDDVYTPLATITPIFQPQSNINQYDSNVTREAKETVALSRTEKQDFESGSSESESLGKKDKINRNRKIDSVIETNANIHENKCSKIHFLDDKSEEPSNSETLIASEIETHREASKITLIEPKHKTSKKGNNNTLESDSTVKCISNANNAEKLVSEDDKHQGQTVCDLPDVIIEEEFVDIKKSKKGSNKKKKTDVNVKSIKDSVELIVDVSNKIDTDISTPKIKELTTQKVKRHSKKKKTDNNECSESAPCAILPENIFNPFIGTGGSMIEIDETTSPIKPKRKSKKKNTSQTHELDSITSKISSLMDDDSGAHEITSEIQITTPGSKSVGKVETNTPDFVTPVCNVMEISSSTPGEQEILSLLKPKRSSKKKKKVGLPFPLEIIDNTQMSGDSYFETVVLSDSECSIPNVNRDESCAKEKGGQHRNVSSSKTQSSEVTNISNDQSDTVINNDDKSKVIIKPKRNSKKKKSDGHGMDVDFKPSHVSTSLSEVTNESTTPIILDEEPATSLKPKKNTKNNKVDRQKIDVSSTKPGSSLVVSESTMESSMATNEMKHSSTSINPKRRSRKKEGFVMEKDLSDTIISKDAIDPLIETRQESIIQASSERDLPVAVIKPRRTPKTKKSENSCISASEISVRNNDNLPKNESIVEPIATNREELLTIKPKRSSRKNKPKEIVENISTHLENSSLHIDLVDDIVKNITNSSRAEDETTKPIKPKRSSKKKQVSHKAEDCVQSLQIGPNQVEVNSTLTENLSTPIISKIKLDMNGTEKSVDIREDNEKVQPEKPTVVSEYKTSSIKSSNAISELDNINMLYVDDAIILDNKKNLSVESEGISFSGSFKKDEDEFTKTTQNPGKNCAIPYSCFECSELSPETCKDNMEEKSDSSSIIKDFALDKIIVETSVEKECINKDILHVETSKSKEESALIEREHLSLKSLDSRFDQKCDSSSKIIVIPPKRKFKEKKSTPEGTFPLETESTLTDITLPESYAETSITHIILVSDKNKLQGEDIVPLSEYTELNISRSNNELNQPCDRESAIPPISEVINENNKYQGVMPLKRVVHSDISIDKNFDIMTENESVPMYELLSNIPSGQDDNQKLEKENQTENFIANEALQEQLISVKSSIQSIDQEVSDMSDAYENFQIKTTNVLFQDETYLSNLSPVVENQDITVDVENNVSTKVNKLELNSDPQIDIPQPYTSILSVTVSSSNASSQDDHRILKEQRVLADFNNMSNTFQSDMEIRSSDTSPSSDLVRINQSFDFSKYADKENRDVAPEDRQNVPPLVGYPIKKDKRIIEFGPFTTSLLSDSVQYKDSIATHSEETAELGKDVLGLCEIQNDKSPKEPLKIVSLGTQKNDEKIPSSDTPETDEKCAQVHTLKGKIIKKSSDCGMVKHESDSDEDFCDLNPLVTDEDFTSFKIANVNEDSQNLQLENVLTLSHLSSGEDNIREEKDTNYVSLENNKIIDDILNKSLDTLLSNNSNWEDKTEGGNSLEATGFSASEDDVSPSLLKEFSDKSFKVGNRPTCEDQIYDSSINLQNVCSASKSLDSSTSDKYQHFCFQEVNSVSSVNPGYLHTIEAIVNSSESSDKISAIPFVNSQNDLCKNISLEINSYGLKKKYYDKNESDWLKLNLIQTEENNFNKECVPCSSEQIDTSSVDDDPSKNSNFSDWDKLLKEYPEKIDESKIWTLNNHQSSCECSTNLGFEDSFSNVLNQSFIPPDYPMTPPSTDNQNEEKEEDNLPQDNETSRVSSAILKTINFDTATALLPLASSNINQTLGIQEPQSQESAISSSAIIRDTLESTEKRKCYSSLLDNQNYKPSESEAINALITLNPTLSEDILDVDTSTQMIAENFDTHHIEGTPCPLEEVVSSILESKITEEELEHIEKSNEGIDEPICLSVETKTQVETKEGSEESVEENPVPKPRITRTPDVTVESFETETEETSESTRPPRGSFDTISSRDLSQDQSVDDIVVVEIKGTVEDIHPSSLELSAHINISTSEGRISRELKESRFTRVQKVIQTRKRIIRKTVIVDGVEKTVEEVIEEPEVINESIQEGGFTEGEMIREESTDSSSLISPVKVTKSFIRINENDKKCTEEHYDTDTPIITEVTDDTELPPELVSLRKEQPIITISKGSEESVKDSISEEETSSTTSKVDYSSTEIDIPVSGDVIIHPELPESFIQQYSNVSNREFVTTVHSSIRTSVKKVRRVNRKIIIKDGKEEIVEEIVDEPEEVEVEESSPQVSSFEHLEGMKNLVQIVNIPESKDVETITEGGSVQTSVHSVTRTINKVIRRVQIIDGREVVTEELIQDPSECQISEVESPSVTVSHRVEKVEEGIFSNSPDVVVNVGSRNQRSAESKQSVHQQIEEKVSELKGFDGSTSTFETSSSKTRVIRKVVIIGDQEMREQLSEPTVEITEVSSDMNNDFTKAQDEIHEPISFKEQIISDIKRDEKDNVIKADSNIKHDTESQNTRKDKNSVLLESVTSTVTMPEPHDFITMEQDHTSKLLKGESIQKVKEPKSKKDKSKEKAKKPKDETDVKSKENTREKSPQGDKPEEIKEQKKIVKVEKSPEKIIESYNEPIDKSKEGKSAKDIQELQKSKVSKSDSKPIKDEMKSVQILTEESATLTKDRKKKSKPENESKEKLVPSNKKDIKSVPTEEIIDITVATVAKTFIPPDFIAREQEHTNNLLVSDEPYSVPTTSKLSTGIITDPTTSEEHVEKPKDIKNAKTKEKKSKDRRRRSTLKSDELVQEALQTKPQGPSEETSSRNSEKIPSDEFILVTEINKKTKVFSTIDKNEPQYAEDISHLSGIPKYSDARVTSKTAVDSEIVEKITSEMKVDELSNYEITLSSKSTIDTSKPNNDEKYFESKKTDDTFVSKIETMEEFKKHEHSPDKESYRLSKIPVASDQVDLKTGKIRKSKKKRPSVKEVFSNSEKESEAITPSQSHSNIKQENLDTSLTSKCIPRDEAKSPSDHGVKTDQPTVKGRKKVQEIEKKKMESADYNIQVETAIQDEKPKVELSVSVNEKGFPVVEVFTSGGLKENESAADISEINQTPTQEQINNNKQMLEETIPLQVPKSDQEPKKKTKKKREKAIVLTESSSIEDAVESDVKMRNKDIPREISVKKQIKRDVDEASAEVCKSLESTSEDDINKRTIKKAKRKLPQLKSDERSSISPISTHTVFAESSNIPVETSEPVMASFPDEPDIKDDTIRILESEKSGGDLEISQDNNQIEKILDNVDSELKLKSTSTDVTVRPENLLAEKKKKKKDKENKEKSKKQSDSHVKISATLTSDVAESSSNVECVLTRDDANSVSLAIQHTDDSVNVSVSTGGNENEVKTEQPVEVVTRVNVSIGRSHSPHSRANISDFIDSERGHSNALMYDEKTPVTKAVSNRKHDDNLISKSDNSSMNNEVSLVEGIEKVPSVPVASKDLLEEIQSIPVTIEEVNNKVSILKAPPQMYQVMLNDMVDNYDVNEINNNLNKLKEAKTDEEVQIIVVSTIVTITEYLEIITCKIYSIKRTTLMSDEEKLVKIAKLRKDLTNLQVASEQCCTHSKSDELTKTIEVIKKGVSDLAETLDNTHSQLKLKIATSDEFLNGVNNVSVLLNALAEDIARLSRDQTTPTMAKLEKLYEYEDDNEQYLKEVVRLRRVGGEVEGALEIGIKNRSLAFNLRDRLEQDLALALEYRDTLDELEQVTAMANNIVNSRPVVNSLEHLHAELQKDRKFFANLTRCRALLESLESHLDEDTRSSHCSLHRDLHRRATQILERASSRAEAMAQTASKWTLLDGRLKEEKAWLGVAAQRVPGLGGVTSADYEQYISLYQTLSLDISQHSGCIWRWLCTAHSLQDLVTCRPLEDSCEQLREVICDLETRVSSDLARLTAFRQVWTRYESLQDRVEHWLNQIERNDMLHQPTTNIVNFWELKAEYEVYKEIKNEAGLEFETAVRTLPICDEQSERVSRSRSADRWAKLEAVLASLQESVESHGGSSTERLSMADKQLDAVRELLNRLESITPADAQQLSLHTEQLQVVKGSVERIGNELGQLGPMPCELADRIGRAQGSARLLESRAFKLLTTHRDTEARLLKLTKAMARLNLHHSKAASILEQAAKAKDSDYDHLMQALEKTQNVVSRLEEDRRLLNRVQDWVAEVSNRCPALAHSLIADVSLIASSQQSLETLANDTLAQLSEQAQLWDHYITKRDGLKSSLRQANYMMDLLTIRSRVDLQHLVKTTNRLDGVAETLGKVEGNEVWTAAEELKAKLSGPEAQALEAEVQGLQSELASTSRQLEAMCTKYRKAAELWASARTLQEQIASSLEQTVAALHNPLPSLAQALPTVTDEEKAKLKELEDLAEGIADQIGVERELLLGKQVDSLTQRLKDVESTLNELAQIQELAEQPTNNGDALNANKSTTEELLDSRDDGTVDRLVELRDHLITLGKNQPNYDSPDSSIAKPSDQTLRHKLQLWEELFRSTFQEYHRVSSKLASTGEANTLVKLWRDYLEQVNAFLTTPLPDEYQSLTYHTSLCQAHQNVLGSQHSILEKKRASTDKVDSELIEEFNTLTNLHNETLAKIIERQQQVASRVGCWERYRDEKNRLLSWLREMETSRNKLNLRYLKIKTVPVTLLNIQDLLDKIPEGENQEKILRENLKKILAFTEDESLAKSLRLDQATIAQRITNMAAALQTWKGYMVRVNEYIDSFESQTNKLTAILSDIRSSLPESDTPDISQKEIKEKLHLLKELLLRVSSANDELSGINETEDRLKEYISPVDAKGVCQRVWILRQQTIELEQNIEMLIQMLEEKLQLAHIYEKREKKFLEWVKSVEERLEGGVSSTGSDRPGGISGEAEDELTRLEAEVEAEMGLRKVEVEWLVTTGEALRRMSPEPGEQASTVEDAWARLQQATQLRSNKLRALIQSTSKLEIRFEELRIWLETMEAKLAQPFIFKSDKKDEIIKLMNQQESIQSEIQKQSSNVADILNTCEIILNDCETCHVSLETQGITSAMENIEKRWKGVCVKSAELKQNLKHIWSLIQQLKGLHEKQEKWLKQQKNRFQKLEHKVATTGHSDLPILANNLQKLESDVTGGSQGLSLVEELYSRVASSACVDSEVTRPLSDLLTLWYQVKRDISNTAADVQATIDKINRFNEVQSECVVGLSAVDALLAIAEAGRASSPSERVGTLAVGTELEKAKIETSRLTNVLSRADTASELLMESSNQDDRVRVQSLVNEYRQLYRSVQDRMERLSKQMVNRSCLVDTLKFESDASTQVNTLEGEITQMRSTYSSNEPSPGSVTRQQAYSAELDSTMAELARLLDQLETTKHSSSLQLNKLLGGCQSTLELVRHLSQSLIGECGLTDEESRVAQVNSLEERFNTLQAKSRDHDQLTASSVSGKLTCPLCSTKNWKQFDNDIWRLEQWLQYAEGFFSSQPSILPASIEQLEDIIQDHREVMLDLDSHHRLVLSLNIIGNHLAEHSEDEARADELRARLSAANTRWEEVCSTAAHWHTKLHQALMQNDEFHENMSSLVEWLERTEITIKESEPVDLTDPTPVIQSKYNRFRELRGELERCEPRVRSLEEAASEVFRGQENRTTVERLAAIRLRLQSLSRLVSVYVLKLGAVLGDDPANLLPLSQPSLDTLSQQLLDNAAAAPSTEENKDGVDTGPLIRSCRFFGRVVRASLPISALLLLVLGATTLVPVTQEDYSCTLANTLLTSFTPVLRYPYGRPPI